MSKFPITPFWRETPLTESEQRLWDAVMQAHHESAMRQNMSHGAAVNAFVGSGSYAAAMASAILTTGGMHAPIAETMDVVNFALHAEEGEIRGFVHAEIESGGRIKGWGNSFIKGAEDDLWLGFQDVLKETFPVIYTAIRSLTVALHACGKNIYPNPSAFTAATALALGIPPVVAPFIFFQGRLAAWTQIVNQIHKP